MKDERLKKRLAVKAVEDTCDKVNQAFTHHEKRRNTLKDSRHNRILGMHYRDRNLCLY